MYMHVDSVLKAMIRTAPCKEESRSTGPKVITRAGHEGPQKLDSCYYAMINFLHINNNNSYCTIPREKGKLMVLYTNVYTEKQSVENKKCIKKKMDKYYINTATRTLKNILNSHHTRHTEDTQHTHWKIHQNSTILYSPYNITTLHKRNG